MAHRRLWAQGIYLYDLPPYSLELDDVEPIFREIKHHDLVARVYTPLAALAATVDDAYARYEAKLLGKHRCQPRLPA